MNRRFTFSRGAVAGLFLLVMAAIGGAAGPQGVARSYKLNIDARLDMEAQGQKQKIDGLTDFSYTWRQNGAEQTLSFDEMAVKVSIDGKEAMNSTMSRAKFITVADGKRQESDFDHAPDELKAMLQDSFSVPVCKVERDEAGTETKRTIVAGPGAKALIDNGIIANAIIFHPPFFANRDEWQSDTEISLGNGGYAKGKLTYKKTGDGKDGQPIVKVSGVLTNDGVKLPNTPITLTAHCAVSGEQTYDAARHDWVAGKLTMDVGYDMVSDNKPVGSAKGTMMLTFERLADK